MVQGTLAADALDLTPYVSGVRLLAANKRNWDQVPITLDGIGDFESRPAAFGGKHQDRAGAIGPHRGRRRICVAASSISPIGEAQAFGGVVKGSIGLASANDGVEVTSHVQFADVDLESCLGQVFSVQNSGPRQT